MPNAGFDPQELTAQTSLNRVVIGDVGYPEIAGMRAEDVCSRDALHALAADYGLTDLRPERLVDDLASVAASTDVHATRAANMVAAGFGRRLGALIATLRTPMSGAEGGTSVHRAFLSHWLAVDSIWLAGGLLAGPCRQVIISSAQAGAAKAARPCGLFLTPYPVMASLLGAACHARATDPDVVIAVADLGHTSIRTAVAQRSATTLTRFDLLDTYAAPSWRSREGVEDAVAGPLVHVARRAAADADFRNLSCGPSRRIRIHLMISVASHVAKGVPVDDGQGTYGCLADRVASLSRRIEAGSDADVTLEFVHDGTAAAATAGSANSGTITAGTWLGAGFKPVRGTWLLDLAPGLRIGRG